MYVKLPEQQHLPRSMEMGRYKGLVYYKDQPSTPRFNASVTCRKCLMQGHHSSTCTNDWVCTACRQPGHKRGQCLLSEADKDADTSDEQEGNVDQTGNADLAQHKEGAEPQEGHPEDKEFMPPAVALKQRRRKPIHKKTTSSVPQNTSSAGKITHFIASFRDRATIDTTLSDSETMTRRNPSATSRPARSPKTPPEVQNDAAKRSKNTPAAKNDDPGGGK